MLSGCSSSGNPHTNAVPANAAPPAPTSAPIPNLNASDLQKGRRPEQNREAPPNNNSAAPPPKSKESHANTDGASEKGDAEVPTATDGVAGSK